METVNIQLYIHEILRFLKHLIIRIPLKTRTFYEKYGSDLQDAGFDAAFWGFFMLKIITNYRELDFSLLMGVYAEGNLQKGMERYPDRSEYEQLSYAEQDHWDYLCEFFHSKDAFLAVWEVQERYTAALRMEPYRDGFLLTALETAPQLRGKGYATELLRKTLAYVTENSSLPVYSHVKKSNPASLAVHKKCGFQILLDHAVYLDGSVFTDSYTLYNKNDT